MNLAPENSQNLLKPSAILSLEEERALFQELQNKNTPKKKKERIKNKIAAAHFFLVHKLVSQWDHNKSLNKDELLSAATVGLSEALSKYKLDNDKKARFGTYARYFINEKIYEEGIKVQFPVKYATTLLAKFAVFNLKKAQQKINEDDPTPQQVQLVENLAQMWIDKEKNKEKKSRTKASLISFLEPLCVFLLQRTLYLDAPLSNDHKTTLLEMTPDTRTQNPEKALIAKEKSQLNSEFLIAAETHFKEEGKEREWKILRERKLKDPRTKLRELAKKFDISEERIYQLEKQAFERLLKFAKTFNQISIPSEIPTLISPTNDPSYWAMHPSPADQS